MAPLSSQTLPAHGQFKGGHVRVQVGLKPASCHHAPAVVIEWEKLWGLLDSAHCWVPSQSPRHVSFLSEGGRCGRAVRGGGVYQRPVFQLRLLSPSSAPGTVCQVPGPRSTTAVTQVRGKLGALGASEPKRGVPRGGGGWLTANLDTGFTSCPFLSQ